MHNFVVQSNESACKKVNVLSWTKSGGRSTSPRKLYRSSMKLVIIQYLEIFRTDLFLYLYRESLVLHYYGILIFHQ